MNPWAGRTVSEMLDESAERFGERIATVDGEVRLTYAQLRDHRDRLAGELVRGGLGPSSRVGLYLAESWEHVVLLYALLHIGAVVVPVNLAWEAPEIADGLTRADVGVLVAGRRQGRRDLLPRLTALGLETTGEVRADALPLLRRVYVDDRDGTHPADWHLQRLLVADGPTVPRSERQESLLVYTSGSSARPKGVVIRQDAALGTAHYVGERLGLAPGDRYLNTNPLYHVGGICSSLLACHQRGVTHYLFPEFDAARMVDVAVRERCTATGAFDLLMTRLLHEFAERGEPLPFRTVAAAPGAVYDTLTDLGISVLMMYASSESSNMSTLTSPQTESERARLSNGYPLPGVEVRIRHPETGQWQPPDMPGEICFRGWNRFVEYYRDTEATAAAIDADGFFHTGDYGSLDGDGRLYFRGRYSMMIKTGGENVSEIEVENFLMSRIPGVRQAAVVGAPDEKWGEAVVAFVELEDPTAFDPDALRAACRGELAGFKIPRRYVHLSARDWPTTPTGKLNKAVLRERARTTNPS